jgi:hypothetical protein
VTSREKLLDWIVRADAVLSEVDLAEIKENRRTFNATPNAHAEFERNLLTWGAK